MKLEVSRDEWKNARSYFKRHPNDRKMKKNSLNTHSFIKVGNMIYALARKKDPKEGYLGMGSQGITVLGQSQKGRQVTVKIESADPLSEGERQSAEYFTILKKLGLLKGKFVRKFDTLKNLLNGKTQSKSYTLLEYIEGQCLFDFLDTNFQKSSQSFCCIEQEYVIALNAAVALWDLHSKNIIHGDVKPENMIIQVNNNNFLHVHLKYIDYNFSLTLPPNQTEIKRPFCAGTKEYVAPEIIEENRYSFQSDIFALGKMFEYDFPNLRRLAIGMCAPLPQDRSKLSDIISYLSRWLCIRIIEQSNFIKTENENKSNENKSIDVDEDELILAQINTTNLPYLVSWEAFFPIEKQDVPKEQAKISRACLVR